MKRSRPIRVSKEVLLAETGEDKGELGKSWNDTFASNEPDDEGEGKALSLPIHKTKKSTVSIEGATATKPLDEDVQPAYVGVKYERKF